VVNLPSFCATRWMDEYATQTFTGGGGCLNRMQYGLRHG